MHTLLKSKAGFLLITSYMVMMVIFILGAAFFTRSIAENNNAIIARNALYAKYLALKGIECAYFEIKNYSSRGLWVTHTVETHDNSLTAIYYPGKPTPLNFVSLPNNSINFPAGPTQSCYVSGNLLQGSFAVKTYQDYKNPDSDYIVILSKGIYGATERLFVTKVHSRTLFDNFIFTPDDFWMNRQTFDAKNGKIWANGAVIFGDYVRASNVGTLNSVNGFRYYVRPYVNPNPIPPAPVPYYVREPWYTPNRKLPAFNGIFPAITGVDYSFINEPEGHVSGDRYGVYKSVCSGCSAPATSGPYALISSDAPTADYPPLPPEKFNTTINSNYIKPQIYRCKDAVNCPASPYYEAQAVINNTTVPNRISGIGSTYWWDKYKYAGDPGATSPTAPNPIGNYIPVNYTNSTLQGSAWPPSGLGSVLITNSNKVRPSLPRTDKFLKAAQSKGIYLEEKIVSGSPKLYVQINGTGYTEGDVSFPSFIQKKNFKNARSGLDNNVAVLDMGQMQSAGKSPQNGIIYAKYGIALKNAASLPAGGLTTVSEENIILQGNYNTGTTWQPSAAIGAKKIYTVSANFLEPGYIPTSVVPATLHNLNYPYVADLVNYYSTYDGTMPHKVETAGLPIDSTTLKPYIQYNISLIGYYGFQPEILERWTYPDTGTTQVERIVQGARVKLSSSDFPASGVVDNDGPCPTCSGRNRSNSGWPWDMTTILGDPNYKASPNDLSIFDPHYVYGSGSYTSSRPPGFMYDDSEYTLLELNNTDTNWNNVCSKLCVTDCRTFN